MDNYKWKLTTFGREDGLYFRKAFEHIRTFFVVKNSEAKIVNYNEYQKLVDENKIAPPTSHWRIKKDQVGIISLVECRDNWTNALLALEDFISGWRACEYEMLNTKKLNTRY